MYKHTNERNSFEEVASFRNNRPRALLFWAVVLLSAIDNESMWCLSATVYIIGLRHCVELNYENNATSAASFIIVTMTRAKRVL